MKEGPLTKAQTLHPGGPTTSPKNNQNPQNTPRITLQTWVRVPMYIPQMRFWRGLIIRTNNHRETKAFSLAFGDPL